LRVILEGSLRHFTAGELLSLLGHNKHTGTLDAKLGEARARLAFRDGRVAWAEATGARDLGEIVTLLMSWREGDFWFLDDVAMPEGVTPLAIDIAPLVAAAEQRAAEEQRLLSLYPDEQMAFRVVGQPQGDVKLKSEEFAVLFQIGPGRTLAQLRADANRPAVELYGIVARLQAAKLIEVVEDPDATQSTRKIPALANVKPVTENKQAPIGTLTADDGTMHPLLEEVTTIGRTAANAIALPDGSVSSTHARVVRTPEGFVLEDSGSRNGTYVNSEKVAGKRVLADGDTVRFGKVLLTFNVAVETKRKDTTQPELNRS
jgi:pSer/pThr/pTyr-binding forkhead associated (FHA) protein